MNFFGHALIAHRRRLCDEAVLGAMLPDFAGMAGLRLLGAEGELGVGVRLHHETDRRFHAHPTFVALCASGIEALGARSVERGPARASCHVGLELLLDGVLSSDRAAVEQYRSALGRALAPQALRALRFREPDAPRVLGELSRRLLQAPLPQAYAEPTRVAERLRRLLDTRPRLSLTGEAAAAVREWLVAVQPELQAAAPSLLGDLLEPDCQP